MRPWRLSHGIRGWKSSNETRETPSMRPWRLSHGIPPGSRLQAPSLGAFNEAMAVKPWNTEGVKCQYQQNLSFNEAMAVKPWNTPHSSWLLSSVYAFNEAMAVKPWNTAPTRTPSRQGPYEESASGRFATPPHEPSHASRFAFYPPSTPVCKPLSSSLRPSSITSPLAVSAAT